MSGNIWDIGIIEGDMTWVLVGILRFCKGDVEHGNLSAITISDNMWRCLWQLEKSRNTLRSLGGNEGGPLLVCVCEDVVLLVSDWTGIRSPLTKQRHRKKCIACS